MPIVPVTRTHGPLHFADLEPKRFEDLCRQLMKEFRVWNRMEPLGRSGSDDGFDARGYERVLPEQDVTPTPDDTPSDRLWLLQCKREQKVGPGQLLKYLKDIVLEPDERLHGVVFAISCNVSKRSRDAFYKECELRGIVEAHIWSSGELEDQLFLPKNSFLRMTYFGMPYERMSGASAEFRVETSHGRMLSDQPILAKSVTLPDSLPNFEFAESYNPLAIRTHLGAAANSDYWREFGDWVRTKQNCVPLWVETTNTSRATLRHAKVVLRVVGPDGLTVPLQLGDSNPTLPARQLSFRMTQMLPALLGTLGTTVKTNRGEMVCNFEFDRILPGDAARTATPVSFLPNRTGTHIVELKLLADDLADHILFREEFVVQVEEDLWSLQRLKEASQKQNQKTPR